MHAVKLIIMDDQKKKNLGGRPSKFDWETLDKLCGLKLWLKDIADIMGLHEDTIRKQVKAKYGVTFSSYADQKMSKTRMRLAQKAIKMALGGDRVMMIFCLKNINGWEDNPTKFDEDQDDIEFDTAS